MRREEAVFIAMALAMSGLSSARGADNPVLGFIAGAIGISVVILLLRLIRKRIMR